jgi:hypothetical protein
VRRADNPHHLHVLIVLKSGGLNLLEPSGPVQGLLYILCEVQALEWNKFVILKQVCSFRKYVHQVNVDGAPGSIRGCILFR